ncbi:MAG TPA: glycine cleavage system protein GcvH [bacterium]|jgi:glycine cleavage system H protein
MLTPENLRYTESHEWIRLEGEEAYVGITDHAQSELGDVVYVELPEIGNTYAAGEECGMIDSAKTTSPLINPVSGTISKVNDALGERPELVNNSAYEEGWMYVLKPQNPGDIDNLMDAGGYQQFVAENG